MRDLRESEGVSKSLGRLKLSGIKYKLVRAGRNLYPQQSEVKILLFNLIVARYPLRRVGCIWIAHGKTVR